MTLKSTFKNKNLTTALKLENIVENISKTNQKKTHPQDSAKGKVMQTKNLKEKKKNVKLRLV